MVKGVEQRRKTVTNGALVKSRQSSSEVTCDAGRFERDEVGMTRRAWMVFRVGLIGLGLMVIALGWWVLQVTLLEPGERGNASSYGQFVLAAVGFVLTAVQILMTIASGSAASSTDELAERLGIAMRQQWTNAAIQRALLKSALLPIRWRRCSESVTSPVAAATTPSAASGFDPLPGITRVTAGQLREGTDRMLHRIYGGLASGRLILTGGPGSGKSSAAIVLLLDALRYRDQVPTEHRAQVPVPVLFTLQGWNPDTEPVRDWIIRKLIELAPLSGRHGDRYAAELLTAGRIAVFLDGLDEIAESHRSSALRALSEQATFRLVLLTRTTELVTAADQNVLTGAVALQLQPLTPADAATYLQHGLAEPAPAPWQNLINTLTLSTRAPIAHALDNPLTITLLRDIYQGATTSDSPVGLVDELLDITRFPTPDRITHHLLDHAITAAYTRRPGQPLPRYTPDTAHRTLTFIAQHLRKEETRDLAWWTIPNWTPRAYRAVMSGLLGAITWGLTLTPLTELSDEFVVGFTGRLMASLLGGLGMGLVCGVYESRKPALIRKFRWNRAPRDSLMIRFVRALGCALVVVLLLWFAGWVAGESDGFTEGPQVGLMGGLVFGPMAGLLFWLATGLAPHEQSKVADPKELWRGGIVHGLVVALGGGLVVGLGLGLWASPWVGLGPGLTVGPLIGLIFGFLLGIMTNVGWLMLVSEIYLCIRHRTPLRLGRFLDEAHERQLLRTVGPIYQFRHATLQDRLAPPALSATASASPTGGDGRARRRASLPKPG
jgi:hypothetical protein